MRPLRPLRPGRGLAGLDPWPRGLTKASRGLAGLASLGKPLRGFPWVARARPMACAAKIKHSLGWPWSASSWPKARQEYLGFYFKIHRKISLNDIFLCILKYSHKLYLILIIKYIFVWGEALFSLENKVLFCQKKPRVTYARQIKFPIKMNENRPFSSAMLIEFTKNYLNGRI